MSDKAALRAQMLAMRQSLPAAVRLQAAASAAHHFADHPFLTYAASFAGYWPVRGEMEPLAIFSRMARYGKHTALPRIGAADTPLTFHRWQQGDPLEEGVHGIKAPLASAPVLMPEVVLVPLLAFDTVGHRLGYGGGYYDRTIAHLRATCEKPPRFVGLAFAAQEVAAVPVDAHDQPLDGVLTETGASFFGSYTP